MIQVMICIMHRNNKENKKLETKPIIKKCRLLIINYIILTRIHISSYTTNNNIHSRKINLYVQIPTCCITVAPARITWQFQFPLSYGKHFVLFWNLENRYFSHIEWNKWKWGGKWVALREFSFPQTKDVFLVVIYLRRSLLSYWSS